MYVNFEKKLLVLPDRLSLFNESRHALFSVLCSEGNVKESLLRRKAFG